MQQDNKKSKTGAIIFWILTVACMITIFYFSSRPADESAKQSGFLLALFEKIFGEGELTQHIVRKAAHFTEFTGLCVLFNSALVFTRGKRQLLLSVGLTSLYAISDEVHQIFVDGRSCQFTDWIIDTLGGVTGMVGFLLLYIIIDFFVRRSNQNEHTNL